MSNKVDNFLDKKLEEIQNKKFEENQVKINAKKEKTEKNKKKRKGIIISALSLALAGLIAIGSFVGFRKKNNNKNNNINKPSITSVDDLGLDEEFTSSDESKIYGDTTGNIKKEDLVQKDGVIYKDKEAANKSDKVGTSSIDLQGGKLEIDKDGDVVVKDEVDYVVKDETGEEISSGTTSKDEIPAGYAFDPILNKLVKEDEVGKFVYADSDYYSKIDGRQYCKKGDIVLKTSLENWKKDPNVTTVKPNINTSNNNTSSNVSSNNTSSSTTTSTTEKVDEGKVNADGTYTIAGVTFIDKATYQAIVLGECNEEDLRYNENGVIYIKENTNSKTR